MKKTYIFLIISIAIAAVIWMVEHPFQSRVDDVTAITFFPELVSDNVQRIEIEQLLNGVVLERTNDGWSVTLFETPLGTELKKSGQLTGEENSKKYKADASKVTAMLDQLVALKSDTVASDNPEKEALYQVGKIGKNVKGFDSKGKKLFDFSLGKEGPEMFSEYIKKDGDKKIFLLNEQLGAMIPSDMLGWRNKKIWSVSPEFIVGVKVTKEGSAYSLLNNNGAWSAEGGSGALLDNVKLGKFIDTVKDVEAARFASESDTDVSFEKSPLQLEIITSDNSSKKLIVGGADKQGYLFAKQDGADEIYLLPSTFVSSIPSDWKDLL